MLSIATSNCELLFYSIPVADDRIMPHATVLILLRLSEIDIETLAFYIVTQIVSLSLAGYVIYEMLLVYRSSWGPKRL
jgi:hypothetical protein